MCCLSLKSSLKLTKEMGLQIPKIAKKSRCAALGWGFTPPPQKRGTHAPNSERPFCLGQGAFWWVVCDS